MGYSSYERKGFRKKSGLKRGVVSNQSILPPEVLYECTKSLSPVGEPVWPSGKALGW